MRGDRAGSRLPASTSPMTTMQVQYAGYWSAEDGKRITL